MRLARLWSRVRSHDLLPSVVPKVGVSPLPAGYEATVFGVYHKCEVKISGNPIIRVISKLPQLGVRSFPAPSAEGGEAVDVGIGGRRASKVGMEKFDLMDGER